MATKQTKPASKPAKGAKPSGSAKTAQKTPAKPASKAKPAAAVKTSAKAAKPSAKSAKPVAKSPAKPAPKKGAPAFPKTAAKGKTGASKTTPKLPVRVLAKSATKPPVLGSRDKSPAKSVKATGKPVAKSPAKPTPKKAPPSVKTPPAKAAPAKATKPVKSAAVKPAPKPAPAKVVAKSAPAKTPSAKTPAPKVAKPARSAPPAAVEAAEAAKPGNMAREAAERARDRAAARTPTPASAPAPTPAPAPTKAPPPAPSGPAPVAASDYGPGPRKSYIPNVDRPTGMYGGVLLCPDPKPFPRKSPYTKTEIDTLRRALRVEQDRLRRELTSMENMTIGAGDGTATNENAGHSLHIAEFASDMQATETLLGVRRMEEERLAHVEEALQRIEKSENYGLCVACGAKIGIERLVAKPHAHLCLDCRRGYEKARRM